MAGQKIGDAYVDLNARFDKLEAALGKVDKEMVKTMKRAEKSTDSLGSAFNKLGGMIAGAFTVQKIAQFTVESIKLAGELEGVRHAYERVADPALMDQLKEATRGTVSELELMKSVTNAANFGIAIERMPELLEFARRRAKDTGQEVGYLVNSIVTGLGRKSTLVLDNLGITAVELRKKLGGVGIESASVAQLTEAVAEISKEAYEGFSEGVDTAADKMQNLKAETENLQTEIGEKLTPAFLAFQKAAVGALTQTSLMMNNDVSLLTKLKVSFSLLSGPAGIGGMAQAISDAAVEVKNAKQSAEIFAANQEDLNILAQKGIITQEQATITTKKATVEQINLMVAFRDVIKTEKERLKTLEEQAAAEEEARKKREEIAAATAAYAAKVEDLNQELKLLFYNTMQAMLGLDKLKTVDLAPPSITTDIEDIPDLSDILGETQDQEFIQFLDDATKNVNKMKIANEALLPTMNALQSGFQALGYSIVDSFGMAETGFGRFIGVLAKGAIDIIAQALATSIAQAITGASTAASFAGPFAPAVLPVTIATMVGSVMSAFAAIPAFAKGGIAPGGMALVGERGPELVNLPKGSMVYPNHETSSIMGKGGAGYLDVNVHGMLKGDKLYLAGERGANRLRR